jgi:hypothetical protein
LDVLGLVRVNFWLAEWSVRPYLSLGAGLHFKDRSRVIVDAVRELPDGMFDVNVRDLSETLIGVASLIAVGAEIPVAQAWRIRAEGRAPIIPLGHLAPSTQTFGLAVGVSYVHR